ncbi:ankyrin repeat-containing domain protein [Aspergillus crustosus]
MTTSTTAPKLTLSTLPPELILLIASHTRSDSTINHFAQTNHFFHTLLNHHLYHLNSRARRRQSVKRRRTSALLWAATHGLEATFRLALPHYTPLRKTKPLLLAAENGHANIVSILLTQNRVNLEATDEENYTALELAIFNGRGPVVKLLLDAGASTTPRKTAGRIRQDSGNPLLNRAVGLGFSEVAKWLILSGKVGLDVSPTYRRSSLVLAAEQGDEEIVECLLKAGAESKIFVNSKSSEMALRHAIVKNFPRLIVLFFDYGAIDVNTTDMWYLQTPIYRAIDAGGVESIRAIVEYPGADLNVVDESGYTPLTWAIGSSALGAVGILLGRGEDVDVNLHQPLCKAIEMGFVDVARMFLETGRLSRDSLEGGMRSVRIRNKEDTDVLLPLIEELLGDEKRDVEERVRRMEV